MIHASALTKHFTTRKRTVEAVRGIDLNVEAGEMVAILGPNGAGKSTTLRMLTTLLLPTSGTAQVAGADIRTQPRQVRSRIGYVGQGTGSGYNQRGRDELISQGRAYGMSTDQARRRAEELIASLDLSNVADRRSSSLSGGQKRRLDIALGLMHTPPLLFLDEPSTGLDPQNRANLHEHIRELRSRHDTTIVFTTHYLDEADQLAERVVVNDHGTIIADDTPERLKAEYAGDRITLTFDRADDAKRAFGHLMARAESARGTHDGVRVVLEVDGGSRLAPALLRELEEADLPVAAVEIARPTLDDVFLNLTGRSLRDAAASEPAATQEVPA